MAFFQWHPKTEGNFRRQTGWDSCTGITIVRRTCTCCKAPKPMQGGTVKGGKFICKECK